MITAKIKSLGTAVIFSFCLGVILAPGASAQAAKPTAQQSKNAAAQSVKQDPSASGQPAPQDQQNPSQDESPNFAPVLYITSVEAVRSVHEPTLDVIRVRGLTSSEGWEDGELVPLTRGTPVDGILDLAFIAQAPSDPATPGRNPTIEAVFTMEPGHPFKGVRVYGATNRVTLHAIPGYQEGAAPPNDCSACVGKYYLAKGETAPAGVSADSIVKQESLPKSVHVIKAGDGMGKLDSDPNRLTLVLDDDGRIVVAVWD